MYKKQWDSKDSDAVQGGDVNSFSLQYDFDLLNGIYFASRLSILLHHNTVLNWNSENAW